jgi:hypothetical protein
MAMVLRSIAEFIRTMRQQNSELLYNNTELRLHVVQLEAALKAKEEESQRWLEMTLEWKLAAANWQQAALAAIAKAEAIERQ